MKKRLLSAFLALSLCLSLLPGTALAEEDPYAEFTGVSSIPTQTYKDLYFNTGTNELEEIAGKDESPYGKGYTSLIPQHELVTALGSSGRSRLTFSDVKVIDESFRMTQGVVTSEARSLYNHEATAVRSVSVDPLGMGMTGVVAVLAMHNVANSQAKNGAAVLTLTLHGAGYLGGAAAPVDLATIPFALHPENAGAYMSMAAGNFDGDDYNTQELAVYVPFGGKTHSGVIEIYRITEYLELESIETLELREQSPYYFPDNSNSYSTAYNRMKTWSWLYQYTQPAVTLETVTQPGDFADDLCITYNAALGGAVAARNSSGDLSKAGITLNPRTPYDAATGVFFWIDPVTEAAKRTVPKQMRFNWEADYGVSTDVNEDAAINWEVMVFGSAGAGDVDGNGTTDVVVAGYTIANRPTAKMDLSHQPSYVLASMSGTVYDISNNEYLATYFTYDPEEKTYHHVEQGVNWVSTKPEDYQYVNGFESGIFTNYGDKDMLHQPLEVTCFADRGMGYPEAVAIGGYVCRLDTDTGVSGWTPYQSDGLGMASFDYGTFEPAYAIPTVRTHWWSGVKPTDVHNRLFTETEALNVDGDVQGLERLAFNYTYKIEGKDVYYSYNGLIGQKNSGDLIVGNRNLFLDSTGLDESMFIVMGEAYNQSEFYLNDRLLMSVWRSPTSAGTVAASDIDNDSVLVRPSTNENGESTSYYFSDPRILAVLQAAPYFAELDHDDGYGADGGITKITFSEGSESTVTSGVSFNSTAQVGVAWGWKWLGGSFETSIMAGATAGFDKTSGTGTTSLRYQSYTASKSNMVSLVMTPYVRYYYEAYDPATRKWEPMEVDVPRQPRATTISTDQYDEAARLYNATLSAEEIEEGLAWEYIGGNVLNNIEGAPASYDSSRSGKSNYLGGVAVGADTPDNFVRVGSDGSGELMSQGISIESSTFSDFTWHAGAALSEEVTLGSFTASFSQEIGKTGGYGSVNFSGTEFEGEVLSIPRGYNAYSFLWNFGTWEDTMQIQGQKQTFPVLGYLVADVQRPEPTFPTTTGDPLLHVVKNGTNALELSWANALGEERRMAAEELGYILYRYQHGAYHPLAMMPASAAKDGWFTFTDRYASPFESFGYAVRPYALLVTEKYIYGPYSDTIDGYTVTDDENRPQVSVTETEHETGKTYTAQVTPATGDVDAPFIQWQYYDRENGGWIDTEDGHGLIHLTVTGSENLKREYRCRVTQRVGGQIYIVYSDVQLSGYVFVADKSREYQNADGRTVVDYVLVYEDGTVEVVASANTRYNTKHVYSCGYDETGELLLESNNFTHQRRSVTEAESSWAEVNGGNDWESDGGHEFSITSNSKVWDVRNLMTYLSKSSAPLLNSGQSPTAVAAALPAVSIASTALTPIVDRLPTLSATTAVSTPTTPIKGLSAVTANNFPAVTAKTLAEKDYISYSYNSGDTLRAAFVHGIQTWSEPSYDDDGGRSTPACICLSYYDEEAGEWKNACSDLPECPAGHACCNPDYA